MICSSEFFIIEDGVINSVRKELDTNCLNIPSDVFGINDGSTITNPFTNAANIVTAVDFSQATNLETIGSYAFYSCTKITSFNLSVCSKLKSIGIHAFYNCISATSIILPEDSQLTVLPGGCFTYCISLKSFIIPAGITTINGVTSNNNGTFALCSSLENITFAPGSRCKSIGSKAFLGTGIKTIKFPQTIQTLTGTTFRDCPKLETIEVEDLNPYFYSKEGLLLTTKSSLVYFPSCSPLIKNNEVTIPSFITSIEQGAFAGASFNSLKLPSSIKSLIGSALGYTYIKNFTIPETVESIDGPLFSYSYKLQNVTFFNKFTKIPSNCFSSCSSMTSFNVPEGVNTLDDRCFSDCTRLVDVYIPNSVTTFGSGVFINCPNVKLTFSEESEIVFLDGFLYNKNKTILKLYLGDKKDITVIDTVQIIDQAAFQSSSITSISYKNPNIITSIGESAFSQCISLQRLTLPDALTSISESLCYQAQSLQEITIPINVVTINDNAFQGCINLKSVSFSGIYRLNNIKSYAFAQCKSLKTINLPSSVTKIEDYAFSECLNLTTFSLPDSLSGIGQNVFALSGITSLTSSSSLSIDTLTSFSLAEMNKMTSYIIPDSVVALNENVFYSCDSLQTVTLGQFTVFINDFAFNSCPELRTIIIKTNKYLENISSLAFNDCPNLKTIKLEGENNFYFENGTLYNKDKSKIIIFLKANNPTEIYINENVQMIYPYAFSDCKTLQKVVFEGKSKINQIQLGAFRNCRSLKSVNFPESLSTIERNAFENCNLQSIYLLDTNITSLPSNVFSGNKRVKTIVLPTILESVTETTFTNLYPAVSILYHGRNVITQEAGLSRQANVYCFEHYPSSVFLGLPVQTHFGCRFTCGHKIHYISAHQVLILFTIFLK